MKPIIPVAMGAALLCGAAMPHSALAAQEDYCARLKQLTDQNRTRFNKEWVTQADAVLRAHNAQNCQRYAEQAEGAVKQLDQETAGVESDQTQATTAQQQTQAGQQQAAATAGQIVVQQPQPQVTVQQQPPQIQVVQPQPQVTVNQPQPQIIVRQAQPIVKLQMPQPVITIEQPQPEIIVRMPEPEVAVNTPQPQVKVSQQQPQVEVRQPQPEVQVQMQQPKVSVQQTAEAQVSVERAQPVVQMQQQGKPEVQVQQQQPQVSYQAAEPKVEVQQGGAPKVEFRQTGEASIRFEKLGNGRQAAAGQQQQQVASTEKTDQDQTGSTSKAGLTAQDRKRIGVIDGNQKLKPAELRAAQLVGKPVLDHQGQPLGTVTEIRQDGSKDFVVIDHGGALKLSQPQLLVPAERLALDAKGRLMLLGLTDQDFAAITRMTPDTGKPVKASQTIRISQAK